MTISGLAACGWPDGINDRGDRTSTAQGPIVFCASDDEPNRHPSSFPDSADRGGGKDAKLTASSSKFHRSCELKPGFSGKFPEFSMRPSCWAFVQGPRIGRRSPQHIMPLFSGDPAVKKRSRQWGRVSARKRDVLHEAPQQWACRCRSGPHIHRRYVNTYLQAPLRRLPSTISNAIVCVSRGSWRQPAHLTDLCVDSSLSARPLIVSCVLVTSQNLVTPPTLVNHVLLNPYPRRRQTMTTSQPLHALQPRVHRERLLQNDIALHQALFHAHRMRPLIQGRVLTSLLSRMTS